MKKIGLLPKLILAIIIGIGVGMLGMEVPIRLLATFNGIFGNFLKFSIPLIIIGFVAPGIGDLGTGAGKLLGITTAIAYISTVLAGSFTYFVNTAVFKMILKTGSMLETADNPEHALLSGYLTINMPPIMDVMTALLMAFILGIGIAIVKGHAIKDVMN
ncbi:MAG: cation:dicarboxylate symporter family transporter, partial [Cetobacterium somerae]